MKAALRMTFSIHDSVVPLFVAVDASRFRFSLRTLRRTWVYLREPPSLPAWQPDVTGPPDNRSIACLHLFELFDLCRGAGPHAQWGSPLLS